MTNGPDDVRAPVTATWVRGDPEAPVGDGKRTILMGGDDRNPTWEQYVGSYVEPAFREALNAVRELVEREGYDFYGDDMEEGYFALPNGWTLEFTRRAWGDFRQAMEGRREGYMRYYMRGW